MQLSIKNPFQADPVFSISTATAGVMVHRGGICLDGVFAFTGADAFLGFKLVFLAIILGLVLSAIVIAIHTKYRGE